MHCEALWRDLVIHPRLGWDPLLAPAIILAKIEAAIDTRATQHLKVVTVRNDNHESHVGRTKQK